MRLFLSILLLASTMNPPDEPTGDPVPSTPNGVEDPCGAIEHERLVGGQVPENFTTDGPLRIVGPDDMVTMDHVPHRLNVDIDEDGIVVGLRCG